MKRKLLSLVVILVVLAGCSDISVTSLNAQLRQAVQKAAEVQLSATNNIQKNLYTFYLPPHIGRVQSTETASILRVSNINILMNLDVIDVIADTYYESENVFKKLVAQTQSQVSFEGTLTSVQQKPITYKVTVIDLGNREVLLTLEGGYFILTAIAPVSDTATILEDMVLLVRSAIVDKKQVLVDYSTRESIDYQQETINLFEQIAPESGSVLDMIYGDNPIDIPDEEQPEEPVDTNPEITP